MLGKVRGRLRVVMEGRKNERYSREGMVFKWALEAIILLRNRLLINSPNRVYQGGIGLIQDPAAER